MLNFRLIWLLLTAAGSLWVSWVRIHFIASESFWNLDVSSAGSWIWKNILRTMARQFVICELGSGVTSSFWHDNWSSLGPLLALTGEEAPRLSDLPLNATVSEALTTHGWWLDTYIINSQNDDTYRWKIGDNSPTSLFSTSNAWHYLQEKLPHVDWHKAVWFSGAIEAHLPLLDRGLGPSPNPEQNAFLGF